MSSRHIETEPVHHHPYHGVIDSLAVAETINRNRGYYWFKNSKAHKARAGEFFPVTDKDGKPDGAYFVESEVPAGSRRVYGVRYIGQNGRVHTISAGHTKSGALHARKRSVALHALAVTML